VSPAYTETALSLVTQSILENADHRKGQEEKKKGEREKKKEREGIRSKKRDKKQEKR
jgi:hypothetical protein